jgi:hypothetical protein
VAVPERSIERLNAPIPRVIGNSGLADRTRRNAHPGFAAPDPVASWLTPMRDQLVKIALVEPGHEDGPTGSLRVVPWEAPLGPSAAADPISEPRAIF